jgi:maltose alpha-D-glucosyltransferase/alpha-amylase
LAEDTTNWYRDAIIYELHIKAFFDANRDGIGDFKGLIRKLDYIKDLGVTAIWVLPFYPSPQKDDGYDIADYFSVHPDYGSIRDFKTFIEAAHARDLYVITELVLNHTSDQHQWFKEARRAPEGSDKRNYYVWSKTIKKYEGVRIIFEDYENSNWTWDDEAQAYYWHRFYSHQPDLNYDHPKVQKEMFKVIDFWLEMGVDGFRLDAVPYLYEREGTSCANLPETHAFLKRLRAHIDAKSRQKKIMLLAEANLWPEDAIEYFGDDDECNMAFHFPVMPRLFLAIQMEEKFPIADIMDQTPTPPGDSQWGLFLRNHDELTLEMVTDEERDYMHRTFAKDPRTVVNLGIRRRLAPLMHNDRSKIELMNILLFSLPGTPFIYYGDEIGMGDNHFLGDRHGVRTPMQWNTDRNAGFSKANPQQLYLPLVIDPTYHHSYVNVENQEKNPSSLLWWMRQIIAIRKNHPAFARGKLEMVTSGNQKVLSFVRTTEKETLLVVANLSQFVQEATLELPGYEGCVPFNLFSNIPFHEISQAPYKIMIAQHGYYWLRLEQAREGIVEPGETVEIEVKKRWHNVFGDDAVGVLANRALRSHLCRSLWFDVRAKEIRRVEIIDTIPLERRAASAVMLIYRVSFFNRSEEHYMIVLDFADTNDLPQDVLETPGAIVAALRVDGKEGCLYDALYSKRFRLAFLQLLSKRKQIKGGYGSVDIAFNAAFKRRLQTEGMPEISLIVLEKKKNAHIDYQKRFFLKLYRKLEEGVPPDREMLGYLEEGKRFGQIPYLYGTVDYHSRDGERYQLALMQEWEADAYAASTLFHDTAVRFFDEVLADPSIGSAIKYPGFYSLGLGIDDIPQALLDYSERFIFEMTERLGRRIAQMHSVLALPTDDEAFAPQPFGTEYLRSWYQTFRNLFRKMCMNLRHARTLFEGREITDVAPFLASEEKVLNHFQQLYARHARGLKIRVHDNLKLDNILFNGKDFILIDFAGDKNKPVSERRLKRPLFGDLAGMMFSMDRVTFRAIRDNPKIAEEESRFICGWRDIYRGYLYSALLRGYFDQAAEREAMYPEDEAQIRLMLDMELVKKTSVEIDAALHEGGTDRLTHALRFMTCLVDSFIDPQSPS